jgi:5-methylcytosine-specific restriction endonuclease McrA
MTNKWKNKNRYGRFIIGHQHHNKVGNRRNHAIDKWLAAIIQTLCKCGCGGYVQISRYHYYRGIPEYIHGHHSNTEQFKAERRVYNETHLGEMSSRWVEDRSKVRTWRKNFLLSQKREIYVRDNGICRSCGTFTLFNVNKYDPLKANFDHVVPIKDGGKTEVLNGQTLCLICHKFKHSAKAKRVNSVNSRTDNTEPSHEIANRLMEGVETRAEETIMPMTPSTKVMI